MDTLQLWRRPAGSRPWVLGHRGVRGTRPENTRVAFEQAAREGADGVELDVRLCRTGEVIVLHDRTLERVTSRRDPRDVERLPWSELRHIDVGEGESVPLLGDVLAWALERELRVNVELKHDVRSRRELAEGVLRVVRAIPAAPRLVLFSSFDPWLVAYLARRAPQLISAWLVHEGQRWLRGAPGFGLVGARAVHPERVLASEQAIAKWQRGGALVNVWTVNDPAEARRLAAHGVDALITDKPGLVLRALAETT